MLLDRGYYYIMFCKAGAVTLVVMPTYSTNVGAGIISIIVQNVSD